MRRIVYLSPFPKTLISGGIKVMFRHVEMLAALGYDASIYCPAGTPAWLSTTARVYAGTNPAIDGNALLVFPEILTGEIGRAARSPTAAAKALLCQNQYFLFNETIPKHTFADLRFVKLLTVGNVARGFLERVFPAQRFDVVPVCVDPRMFFAREKALRIAAFPRKLTKSYALIRQILVLKYPELRTVPWDLIDGNTEQETAEILGRAAVFLSLCELECAPLTPLEAMASGCIVVGFHGYGGLEYASDANGVWLRPDHLEETADAVAAALFGIEHGEPRIERLREGALATVAAFDPARTSDALHAAFSR